MSHVLTSSELLNQRMYFSRHRKPEDVFLPPPEGGPKSFTETYSEAKSPPRSHLSISNVDARNLQWLHATLSGLRYLHYRFPIMHRADRWLKNAC
jgi:hypothetical protein